MKLCNYLLKSNDLKINSIDHIGRLGLVVGSFVIDVYLGVNWSSNEYDVSSDLIEVLHNGQIHKLRELEQELKGQDIKSLMFEGKPLALPLEDIKFSSPITNPSSFRDFYAFEEHVKTCREKRGLGMVKEWYEAPVFYYSNHNNIFGCGEIVKPQTKELDFELEVACIIGKDGENISKEKAHEHILGLTILNDWSARDIQRQEMKVGLGPAKGKDFASSIGPFIVTLDELESKYQDGSWDLSMIAKVNGEVISKGNLKDIYWTFYDMIERASHCSKLYCGDILGSGTVGTGCILELGTDVHRWLEPGDIVELEVEGLGTLTNSII